MVNQVHKTGNKFLKKLNKAESGLWLSDVPPL